MKLSVIICAHNPRADYMQRTLDALKAQTLPKEQWELLLIDNASKEALVDKWDLSWHPNSRQFCEEKIGLIQARLLGITNAQGDVLVFVDDDNILASDYLITAWNLALSHNWVGAFGGNNAPEFETQPEPWLDSQKHLLAIASVNHEEWAYGKGMSAFKYAPCGAGMVIRRNIASHYSKEIASNEIRLMLGRKSGNLASAEDSDMALCACDLGYAVGHFPQLVLTHLIPTNRIQPEYILRLSEEMVCSYLILEYIRDGVIPEEFVENLCRSEKLFRFYKKLSNRIRNKNKNKFQEELETSWKRGRTKAIQYLKSFQNSPT